MSSTTDPCTGIRRSLSARRDGLAVDPAALATHLAACADCRAWSARIEGLDGAWAELAAEPIPASLWPRIAELGGPAAGSRPRWRRLALQRAAALLLGLASVGGLAVHRSTRPQPHDPSRLLRALLDPPARARTDLSTEHRLLTPFEEASR